MAEEKTTIKIDEIWKKALISWYNPSVSRVIVANTSEELEKLGEIGKLLQGNLAFMKFPEFQTYINLENVVNKFSENPVKGVSAISKHEIGHRYCPYDTVTLIMLNHCVKKTLEGEKLPYDVNSASSLFVNLFTDMCINTKLSRNNDEDISWAYEQLSKSKNDERLWQVYSKSMELSWKKKILPKNLRLSEEQIKDAQEIADLFAKDFFVKSKWQENIKIYSRILSKYLESKEQDCKCSLSNTAGNIPKQLDEKTAKELAKRLAEIGSDGLPKNPSGMKDFRDIMAGFGQGNPINASIQFYDMLSDSYDVFFAEKPFGRPRISPFQPVKWHPSMGPETLDVNYSVQLGGKIIPGLNAYSWNQRKRESKGGVEEVVQDLDLYIDTSISMPNPIETISLPVLASFVVVKKAHRKGANIRATVFSGKDQSTTTGPTRDLKKIYETITKHYNGGTVFPTKTLTEGSSPRQVLIITDTFLGNNQETCEAIRKVKRDNDANNIAIYAISNVTDAEALKEAGAEIIQGTTTKIFKKVIGKANEVYTK